MVQIFEVASRTPELVSSLLAVWEGSVRATHLFLSESEIEKIKEYVPQALSGVKHLVIATNELKQPVAFTGVANESLEILFVSPDERGRGIGKKLINYGIENYGVKELAVNEQNQQARGFYEHMGLKVYKRTDLDEQGDPYPLLYMKLLND